MLEDSRGEHQLAHDVWVPNRGLQRDPASQGKAKDIGSLQVKVLDQGSDIIGHQLVAERPLDVGRMPLALELDSDDAPGRGKLWHDRAHRCDGHVGAGKQHQRLPAPMDLVVQVQTVD